MNFGTYTDSPSLKDVVCFHSLKANQEPVMGRITALELENNLVKLESADDVALIIDLNEGRFDIIAADEDGLTDGDKLLLSLDYLGDSAIAGCGFTAKEARDAILTGITQEIDAEYQASTGKIQEAFNSDQKPEPTWHRLVGSHRDTIHELVTQSEKWQQGKANKSWGKESRVKELYGHHRLPTYIEHEDCLLLIQRNVAAVEVGKSDFLILEIHDDEIWYTLPLSVRSVMSAVANEDKFDVLMNLIK